MANDLHHVSVFVAEMDRAISLFRDILGFELVWRVPKAGGKKISALLGIPDMEAELTYLQTNPTGVAIELCRLIRPEMDMPLVRFGGVGTVGLSLTVGDLDRLYQRLTIEGWPPLTPCMNMRSPDGHPIRVFCIRVEDSLTLEFIELSGASGLNDEMG